MFIWKPCSKVKTVGKQIQPIDEVEVKVDEVNYNIIQKVGWAKEVTLSLPLCKQSCPSSFWNFLFFSSSTESTQESTQEHETGQIIPREGHKSQWSGVRTLLWYSAKKIPSRERSIESHCPNGNCTALKRTIRGTLLSGQFEQVCQITFWQ